MSEARISAPRFPRVRPEPAARSPPPVSSPLPEMVGHLDLQAMEESAKGRSREGLLDSPDSGLPPSPSPPLCAPSPGLEPHAADGGDRREGKLLPYLLLNTQGAELRARLQPVVYGESIEVNPKPEQEFKFSCVVKYASDKHFREQMNCAPVSTITSYRETVVMVHNSTWRSYKAELHLQPKHRPVHFQTTAIIYPKHARTLYRTTLNYNSSPSAAGRRRFVSAVRLESYEDTSPCIIYTEDL
ncbi:refilin-A isoform X2 [Denticeps clupeoides]|uniref:Uncharacterized protein n=1 Tax=Denticeps clupeoides TaxID=299321 RepID=A0AAY4CZD9_9TELE|nr:refilin-A-like isoform X2 [Denticeps clupeoides]